MISASTRLEDTPCRGLVLINIDRLRDIIIFKKDLFCSISISVCSCLLITTSGNSPKVVAAASVPAWNDDGSGTGSEDGGNFFSAGGGQDLQYLDQESILTPK